MRRALPLVSRAERPRLLGLSAIIESFTGSLAEAVTTLQDGIAASEDPSLSLEMLLDGFGLTVYLADYEKMHELCVRAAEFPPVTDADRFIVTVLTGAAAELDGDYRRAKELLECAIEIATRLDDVRYLIWVSAGAGRAGNWGDGLPYARRAVRLAREHALVSTLPYALEAQATQLLGRGQFDLASPRPRRAEASRSTSGSNGSRPGTWLISRWSTRCAAMKQRCGRASENWRPRPRAAHRL